MQDGKVKFLSNMGAESGGISSGQDVVVRFAVKPTSSINTPRKSVTTEGAGSTFPPPAATTLRRHPRAPCRWARR